MARLNIVLVEPRIPQNTGNIARTCAATGAALHLVGPLGFKPEDKKLKRAGLDYWHLLNVSFYDNLEAFLGKNKEEALFFFSTKANKAHSQAHFPDNSFLVFGREDQGLPAALIEANKQKALRIPMVSQARSLNLSNAVAVAVYEVLRQWDFPTLVSQENLQHYDWASHQWQE